MLFRSSFSWFEAPGARNLQQARDFLLALGAMNSEGELTKLGNSLREMPIHPRLGKMLLVGSKMGIPNLTSELAALLSEPSGKGSSRMSDWENDILSRWYEWRRSRGSPRFRNLDRAAKQLQEMLSGSGTDICSPESAFEQFLPELFLEVFPEDRKSTRLNSSHSQQSRMPSSA